MEINSPVKKVFLLCLLSSIIVFGQCQVKMVQLSHYLFPEFEKGIVLMKSGDQKVALLNYNELTSEMIFDNNGTKLAFSQTELVDTIYIQDRKFVLLDKKFVELIYKSKCELFADYKCSIVDPGKPSGYGGTSQTAATTTFSSFYTSGQVYNMKLPEGTETKSSVEYWLRIDGNLNKFVSLRQMYQSFPDKKELIKNYRKTHNPDYDNLGSIIEMIKFLEKN
ncbi:MAG: hypothetical protein WAO52_13555 [Prolixibacteraceae bacterium]